jgi:hypothetical protein
LGDQEKRKSNQTDAMEIICITTQLSRESNAPSAAEQIGAINTSFADPSCLREVLSNDGAAPVNTIDVFRDRRRSLVEEMFWVLKRANPVQDYRDDEPSDCVPVAKRSRTSHYMMNDLSDLDEREGAGETDSDRTDSSLDERDLRQSAESATRRPSSDTTKSLANLMEIMARASTISDD